MKQLTSNNSNSFAAIAIFLSILNVVTPIMVPLNGIEIECFFKTLSIDDKFRYSFVVSGVNQETVVIELYDPFHGIIKETKGKADDNYEMNVKYNGK